MLQSSGTIAVALQSKVFTADADDEVKEWKAVRKILNYGERHYVNEEEGVRILEVEVGDERKMGNLGGCLDQEV